MRTRGTGATLVVLIAAALGTVLGSSPVQAQSWPGIFDPTQLLTLNLTMNPADWDTIRFDLTFDIDVSAQFWADGESPITVAVRRKSCTALPDEIDPFKISLKIDINKIVSGQEWHGLKKLSLENGDDVDVVAEGLACNLHGMASGPEGYNYAVPSYYANWVVLNVNGVSRGVYINQEQHDKTFMQHRNLYIHGESWLYQTLGQGNFEAQVADDSNPRSPRLDVLCYTPFAITDVLSPLYVAPPCAQPDPATLVTQLNQEINMQAMLTMAAVDVFVANPDGLFTHYNNAFFYDADNPTLPDKRMYFAWDQDSVLGNTSMDIYERSGGATEWETLILANPTFRPQYNQIMRNLLDSVDGLLSETNIHAFLDTIEPVLHDALAADPYNQFDPVDPPLDPVTERFSAIRAWVTDRIANVLYQVDFDEPVPPPGIVLLQDGFEGTHPWVTNWVQPHYWLQDTGTYARGAASATADKNNNGDLICNALDTNYATAVHVDFWYMKDDTDLAELQLYYYNGTTYNSIVDLTTVGDDDVWLHYTDIITDGQYFGSDFRIRIQGIPNHNTENVWVDDVIITKEISDADGDLVPDEIDNCPNDSNPGQENSDADSHGDVCDNCPNDDNEDQADGDTDGVGDVCDNCPNTIPGATVDENGCPPVVSGDFDGDGDVDQNDYDDFALCSSGPAIPYTGDCAAKDFDSDNDVDQNDFAIFQRCYSGTNNAGDPNCAN
ncbi:MAG: CotH kinase family protein [Planctomycetota bacterium]|jgi:hypothetical protein